MEDKQEQKEQDKPVDVPLADEKVEKEEVTKCCGSTDCSKKGCDDCCLCCSDFLGRIRGFFSGFSLGCSSSNCVLINSKKTVAQTVEEKKEQKPEVKETNVV
jgi:hypothetical protein